MFGALIEKGLQNWQIIQQTDGFAEISVEGTYVVPDGAPLALPVVCVRVVREESSLGVTGWQEAEMLDNCSWKITLKIPAGGLYRLETCLATRDNPALEWSFRGDLRHHWGVGDLYVIAGQSNSTGYGKDSAYDPPELGVHVLRNSMTWDLASHPLGDSTDSLHPVNTDGALTGASPYLSFGKMLKKELGYPIGLLQTSRGGTPLSWWTPAQDGRLYHNMMDVIRSQGGKVKGVLWYQGCSDTGEVESAGYKERFVHMIGEFRRELGAEVPWLTIQLNRSLSGNTPETDRGWGIVREAQRQIAREVPGISVIPATDCGLSDCIHNNGFANMMLGERAAGSVLRSIYQKPGFDIRVPDLEHAVLTEPNTIRLEFSGLRGRLESVDDVDKACGIWTVRDEAGEVKATDIAYEKNILFLTLERPVQGACTISAGWQTNPPLRMPMDMETHLPVLSFFEVPVEMK